MSEDYQSLLLAAGQPLFPSEVSEKVCTTVRRNRLFLRRILTTDFTDFTDGFRNLRASVSVQSVLSVVTPTWLRLCRSA
jgi:hypothetical protein